MKRKYDGSLLSDVEKAVLAARVTPTLHSLSRIKERCPDLNLMKAILESKLVYWSRDGYIIVSLPKEKSMVIDHNFRLITVRNPSENMYSNADRWVLTRWRATDVFRER